MDRSGTLRGNNILYYTYSLWWSINSGNSSARHMLHQRNAPTRMRMSNCGKATNVIRYKAPSNNLASSSTTRPVNIVVGEVHGISSFFPLEESSGHVDGTDPRLLRPNLPRPTAHFRYCSSRRRQHTTNWEPLYLCCASIVVGDDKIQQIGSLFPLGMYCCVEISPHSTT